MTSFIYFSFNSRNTFFGLLPIKYRLISEIDKTDGVVRQIVKFRADFIKKLDAVC